VLRHRGSLNPCGQLQTTLFFLLGGTIALGLKRLFICSLDIILELGHIISIHHILNFARHYTSDSRGPCLKHVSTCIYIIPTRIQANILATVTAEEEREYAVIIDDILSQSDLNTVSAKAIRKGIQQRVDHDISAKKVIRDA
jgi:hypothetical protein